MDAQIGSGPLPDDPVTPTHYSQLNIQPLRYILANDLDFCEGNIIKYVSRYRLKGGLTDLLKAREYLDQLITKRRAEETPDWA